ncbi:MAG: hypothetical protein OEX04_20170, partial [Acidimicrobiia bacterium]|nr:hypothetical protein [Acidimicrobiia bacterium]
MSYEVNHEHFSPRLFQLLRPHLAVAPVQRDRTAGGESELRDHRSQHPSDGAETNVTFADIVENGCPDQVPPFG